MLLLIAGALVGSTIVHVGAATDGVADGSMRRPFSSLADGVRWLEAHPHGAATIALAPGRYSIDKPIVISNAALSSPLTIASADPKRPAVIDGARTITGWKVLPTGWWTTRLPDDWYFSELFVDGKRRSRPRLPRSGYYTIGAEVAPSASATGHGADRFAYLGSEIDPSWSNLQDIELVLFHNWSVTEGRIGKIDAKTVTLKSPTCSPDSWAALPKGNRFVVDNVKEALGNPGDWYLDRASHILTYVPMPGEDPRTSRVCAPVATSLMIVKGDQQAKKWASGLTVKNLKFEHSLWNIPPEGRSFPQAEADLHGAI